MSYNNMVQPDQFVATIIIFITKNDTYEKIIVGEIATRQTTLKVMVIKPSKLISPTHAVVLDR